MIFPELVHSFPGLITDYDFPVYSRTVDISLPETLVHRLLLTEEGFSTYSRSAAFSITNKYTVRIYWLICSWRSKGGFVISLSNLRKILALGRGYDRYENITCKILRPAAEDLEGRFPIWFLYKTYGSGEERNSVQDPYCGFTGTDEEGIAVCVGCMFPFASFSRRQPDHSQRHLQQG